MSCYNALVHEACVYSLLSGLRHKVYEYELIYVFDNIKDKRNEGGGQVEPISHLD